MLELQALVFEGAIGDDEQLAHLEGLLQVVKAPSFIASIALDGRAAS